MSVWNRPSIALIFRKQVLDPTMESDAFVEDKTNTVSNVIDNK